MSAVRETCGTLHGALAHQAAGERMCGWCARAEAVARASAEGIPSRPSPLWPPVTPEQARAHAEILDAEVARYELDNPTGRGIRTADELAERRRKRGAA